MLAHGAAAIFEKPSPQRMTTTEIIFGIALIYAILVLIWLYGDQKIKPAKKLMRGLFAFPRRLFKRRF